MKQQIIKVLSFTGLILLISSFIIMSWTFFSAYLTPDKATLVTINEYGEANWEMILFIYGFIAVGTFIAVQATKFWRGE